MYMIGDDEDSAFSFRGNFDNNEPKEGTLTYKITGDIYKGKFFTFDSGYGEIKYNDGSVYQGYWNNYKRNGIGYIIFNNRDTYRGEFIDNEIYGKGEYFNFHLNKITIGNWKNGKEDGEMLIYINNKTKPIKTLCRDGITVTILEL